MMASVIMPMLNEERNVLPAYEKIRDVMDSSGCTWELICVDDGSTDSTFEKTAQLSAQDRRVNGLRLSRNFGFHAALTAGLSVCRGDFAFSVGADVQEPLDQIPEFIQKWNEGYEVVWGIRSSRQDPLFTRIFSSLFYSLLTRVGRVRWLPKHASFVVIDRKVIDAIATFPERNRIVWALIGWMGFRQTQIRCAFGARERGTSRWTMGKRIVLAIDAFTSLSFVPIRTVSLFGVVIAILSFLYGIGVVVNSLVAGASVEGWPTLIAAVLFLGGLQLLMIGLLGEYIWRGLSESRGRPLYIVAERLGPRSTEGDGRDGTASYAPSRVEQRTGPGDVDSSP